MGIEYNEPLRRGHGGRGRVLIAQRGGERKAKGTKRGRGGRKAKLLPINASLEPPSLARVACVQRRRGVLLHVCVCAWRRCQRASDLLPTCAARRKTNAAWGAAPAQTPAAAASPLPPPPHPFSARTDLVRLAGALLVRLDHVGHGADAAEARHDRRGRLARRPRRRADGRGQRERRDRAEVVAEARVAVGEQAAGPEVRRAEREADAGGARVLVYCRCRCGMCWVAVNVDVRYGNDGKLAK